MRKELEEKSALLSGARRYEGVVGPVIEEYEKTIGAIEAELKLGRTALIILSLFFAVTSCLTRPQEHTNETYNEQEGKLAAYRDHAVPAASYIEALRSRLAELAECETSTQVSFDSPFQNHTSYTLLRRIRATFVISRPS